MFPPLPGTGSVPHIQKRVSTSLAEALERKLYKPKHTCLMTGQQRERGLGSSGGPPGHPALCIRLDLGADAVGGWNDPAWTISPRRATAHATGESFPDGSKNCISMGISIANNFIFTLVTPSKLPKCVQELSRPVMQWHKLCDVLLSCKSRNSEQMK